MYQSYNKIRLYDKNDINNKINKSKINISENITIGVCDSIDLNKIPLIKENLADCGWECWGNKECVSKCMSERLDINKPCSLCMGEFTECTKNNCFFQCIGGDSEMCQKCLNTSGCISNFEKCSGIDINRFK